VRIPTPGKRRLVRVLLPLVLLAGLTVATSATIASASVIAPNAVTTTATPCDNNGADKSLTRAQVLIRARSWLSLDVPYSQERCYRNQYGDYRTDCSGFVSMAWGLGGPGNTFWTGNLDTRSHPISRGSLRPGDALLRYTGDPHEDHVALFVMWADSGHTQPVVFEQTGSADSSTGRHTNQHTWSSSYASLYTPVRYDNIRESGTDTYGYYNPADRSFHLKNNFDPTTSSDIAFATGWTSNVQPLLGDWDGNGTDTYGYYDPAGRSFHLKNNFDPTTSSDIAFATGWTSDVVPLLGDWDGNGTDTYGYYNPADRSFHLKNNFDPTTPSDIAFATGWTSDVQPLVGDWDGN